MSQPPTVLVAAAAGVTRLTLNRPDKLNAFNRAMHAELGAALDAADRDPACRVVILEGAGRGFSAGQDLADGVVASSGPQPDLGLAVEAYNVQVRRVQRLGKPVLAKVHGACAGASANLALACDIVVAARSATFLQPFARLGLVPDGGGTWLLPHLIGEARARALTILAEPISGEQAAAWGMIWKAVEDERLDAEVDAIAGKLATAATRGIALQKRAFLSASGNTLDAQLDVERDLQRLAGKTPDYLEGVTAFLEKRKPTFTGKTE
jgi:2-(1,2-epoxy-1,2-dihydrophenyl)acetyl-CoA isomerase